MISHPALALLKRELFTSLRGGRLPLCLVGLLLAMSLALLFTVQNRIGLRQIATGNIGTQDIQSLFMVFAMIFYAGAALLMPPMASLSICMEKQQETFDQLIATRISPLTLVLAKLGNVLGVYTIIFIGSFPVMAVTFFLIGVDWVQFVYSVAVVAASALSLASIGLFFSAFFYRPASALVATYFTGFMFHLGMVLVVSALAATLFAGTGLARAMNNPDPALLSVLYPVYGLHTIRRGVLDISGLAAVLAYHGAITLLCLSFAVRILRRPARPPRVNQERPVDDPAVLDARRRQFPYYLLDPRRRRPMIPDGKNPVYVRELQTSLANWGVWRIRVAYCFGIGCFLLSIHSIWTLLDQTRFVRSPYSSIMIGTLVVLVFVPPSICLSMTREYESENADMLRMTLLHPREIAAGKFRAALAFIAPMLAGILFGALPLAITGYGRVAGDLVAMILVTFYTLALVYAATAAARRTVSGLLLGYGAVVMAHAALPYGMLIALELLSPRFFQLSTDDSGVASFISPYCARIYVNYWQRYGNPNPALESYWFFHTTLFIPITLFLLWFASRRFQRQFNRS